MKRRSFLKSAAAFIPTAGLQALALSHGSESPSSDQVHVVTAGQDRLWEAHSRGYSSILFKVLPRETNGGMFIIEHVGLVKGGPPLHLHLHQEEWFYVMEGEVLFQIGDGRKQLRAGDSVLGPRGVPHTFSSVGEKPGRMVIAFNPAGKMEDFLRATAIPNPPVQDAAFFRRYEMELVGPPIFAS
ncbi:cupin domain-containing protein [Acidicapsa acidisoli]|uniref:cupin domain-containing protein n=1 Tax=Acidicapsa acidisoli TaxID=1615681 RepID=UPI0021DF8D2C|nr:cupin domain-containing protein [Acidicapsa acidisoli]